MRFTKVHGAGNDFILIDAMINPAPEYTALAQALCHRQTGIGADGLLIALPSAVADIRMRIINKDGSEAEMCGNGIRAFARYAYERGLVNKKRFAVETLAGNIHPELVFNDAGIADGVKVNMGKPQFDCRDIPVKGVGKCLKNTLEAASCMFTFSSVRMNIPHTAVKVDDPLTFDILTYGPAIERHPLFPERTNVDFYHVIDRENIEMRVWERGAGPTLACGTGACATAVLCAANGETARRVNVHLELGTLLIEWAENDDVYMTGPATIVFDGETL